MVMGRSWAWPGITTGPVKKPVHTGRFWVDPVAISTQQPPHSVCNLSMYIYIHAFIVSGDSVQCSHTRGPQNSQLERSIQISKDPSQFPARMAGAVSVVGSSLVESKPCPCLCFDALPSCNLTGGDLISQRNTIGRKHAPRLGSLDLRSSFLDYSSVRTLSSAKILRKQRKNKSLVVVDELAGQYEDNFEDVKKQILDYFTYKAVRTVLYQLYEMNPPQYRWFYNYVASNEHGYGKSFIRNLAKDKQELAERVMVTRLHLYGKWIKKCDHTEMYQRISDQNLELMRERLKETVIWPTDDTNTEVVG